MPDYSFLVGKPDCRATFRTEDTDEEIAYACDWVPIAWLALFKPEDVVLVDERLDDERGQSEDSLAEPPRSCGTLIAERRSALANLDRRLTRLERVLPADLVLRVRGLEAKLERSRSPCIQLLVTDIDLYVSHGDSADILRMLVATMDSDDLDRWRVALSYVHAQVGATLSEIAFPKAREAAVVGYLSDPVPPSDTSDRGTNWFTRNEQFTKGWRSLVRPLYLKLFACLLIAAVVIMAWQAV
jgi:hypothetical protein